MHGREIVVGEFSPSYEVYTHHHRPLDFYEKDPAFLVITDHYTYVRTRLERKGPTFKVVEEVMASSNLLREEVLKRWQELRPL